MIQIHKTELSSRSDSRLSAAYIDRPRHQISLIDQQYSFRIKYYRILVSRVIYIEDGAGNSYSFSQPVFCVYLYFILLLCFYGADLSLRMVFVCICPSIISIHLSQGKRTLILNKYLTISTTRLMVVCKWNKNIM